MSQLSAVAHHVDENGERVVDHIVGQLVDRCRRGRIDFVGFKLWSGDGFEVSVQIAERLRQTFPSIKLFAGGPAVHYSGDAAAAEAPVFDAIVDGDGEAAIVQLARFCEGRVALDNVPNLVGSPTSGNHQVETELSTLPEPEYGSETYPSVEEGAKLRLFSIDESRGCPIRCAFCINWCIEGARWRTRTVEQVVSEIRGFREQSRSTFFRLAGTYSPPRLVRDICSAVLAADLQVRFSVSLHANGVTDELLQLLTSAGCFGVFFGAESGSDEILERSMKKRVDAARLERSIRAALDCGLFTVASFIIPAPHETPATEATTKAFIKSLFAGRDNSAVTMNFPGLLPRTSWWTDRGAYGFKLEVPEDDYRGMLLHYKIRHLLPPNLWEPLPYSVSGVRQTELAARTASLQAWARDQGIGVNLPDHDAQIGAALGYSPFDFKEELRRLIFTGDSEGMWELVRTANQAAAP